MKNRLLISFISVFSTSICNAAIFSCTPNEVGQFDNRIHIRCEQSFPDNGSNIVFFSVPTTGSTEAGQTANRFLSVGMAALASGKSVTVLFNSGDTSGTTYGCGAPDCRKPYAFFLSK